MLQQQLRQQHEHQPDDDYITLIKKAWAGVAQEEKMQQFQNLTIEYVDSKFKDLRKQVEQKVDDNLCEMLDMLEVFHKSVSIQLQRKDDGVVSWILINVTKMK